MGKSYEQRYQEHLDRLERLCLMDDDFMSCCFDNQPECTELVLHIILDKPDLRVTQVSTRRTMTNLQGRAVRLDIYAEDSTGKRYNIEVQRSDHGAGVKRARYNSSLLDMSCLSSGEPVDNLPETYVIFITQHDVLRQGKAVYTIDRYINGQTVFGDGSHIVYVNGAFRGQSQIGQLMHDFGCTDPDDMNFAVLANRTSFYKRSEEGVQTMCKIFEELRDEGKVEGKAEGRAEGKTENAMETALRMLKKGKYSVEEIADLTGLSVETVQNIQQ